MRQARGRTRFFPAISWGAWQTAGLRGESQPIEPDPGHAGGGRDASAAATPATSICLPSRLTSSNACASAAARALHHQRGGADLHRQRAAGGRRRAVDDHRRRRRSKPSSRAPTRCWSISAPSTASGRRPRGWRSPEHAGRHPLGARPGVHRPHRAARGLRPHACVAKRPRAVRLEPGRIRSAGGRQVRRSGAGALCAQAMRTVVGLTGEIDLVRDGETPRDHRQRSSADGARDRDGLRRLGAGRRLSRGRGRCLGGDRGGAHCHAASPARSLPQRARGPGSFAIEILDALYNLDRNTLMAQSKGDLMRVDLRCLRHRRSRGVGRPRPGRSVPRARRRRRDAGAAARQAVATRASWSSVRARSRLRSAACRS